MKILRMKNAIRAKSALDEKEKILCVKAALKDVNNHKAEVHEKTPPAEQETPSETIQPAEKIMYTFAQFFLRLNIFTLIVLLARWNPLRRKAKLRN
jgi:hypothetical protein